MVWKDFWSVNVLLFNDKLYIKLWVGRKQLWLNDEGYVICRHGNNVSYNRLFSQGTILADFGLLIAIEYQNKHHQYLYTTHCIPEKKITADMIMQAQYRWQGYQFYNRDLIFFCCYIICSALLLLFLFLLILTTKIFFLLLFYYFVIIIFCY